MNQALSAAGSMQQMILRRRLATHADASLGTVQGRKVIIDVILSPAVRARSRAAVETRRR